MTTGREQELHGVAEQCRKMTAAAQSSCEQTRRDIAHSRDLISRSLRLLSRHL